MENEIDDLLLMGDAISFDKNSRRVSHGTYGTPSSEFRTWAVLVQNFVIEYFGVNSSLYKLFEKFNIENIEGNEISEFNNQKAILVAVLNASKKIKPKVQRLETNKEESLLNLFDKFHSIVIQMRSRYNNRPTLDVSDEYDVQDLLHCLLKLHFKDIRKEEWTPSYAGGSSRMDFLLKEEQVVVEVKKTRIGLDDKALGKQLIEDKAKYKVHPDCKKLLCFTYDPEGRILNPKGLLNDLNSNDDNFEVQIIIKPDN